MNFKLNKSHFELACVVISSGLFYYYYYYNKFILRTKVTINKQ